MDQCERCRYAFEDTGLRCKKKLLQECRRDGDMQMLLQRPGLCKIVNPDNNCDLYRPKLRVWLKGLFQAPT